MINLLPEDAKEYLTRERFTRFVIVIGVLSAILACLSFLLLWVRWFALTLEEQELRKEFQVVQQSSDLLRIQNIESQLASLNKFLDAYERNWSNIIFTSPLFDRVRLHAPSGVFLTLFSYNRARDAAGRISQFRIEGIADNRATLLLFRDRLDQDPFIENIRSPISSFLQETNIEFSFTFDASPSLPKKQPTL